MPTIGEKLTEARQRQGLRVEEAAEFTHVRAEYLRALENDQFEAIPLTDVYRRGFIKIYARFLKLDPDRILADYTPAHRDEGDRHLQPSVITLGDDLGGESLGAENGVTPGRGYTPSRSDKFDGHRKKLTTYAIIGAASFVVLVLAVVVAFPSLLKRGQHPAETQDPSDAALNAGEDTTANELSFQLVVHSFAYGRITITQKSDGKVVCDERFADNTRKSFSAKGPLKVESDAGIEKVRVQIGQHLFYAKDKNAKEFFVDANQLKGALATPRSRNP
ncbi:MAG: helix-turn-helix domain-containing protein [Puniceicoccales bacterium]|jgi:transcriptional regulator with XRE-family HTH domain|nr:helix-turn-helix domain-containing protein [Puniceicoccales bacterium]